MRLLYLLLLSMLFCTYVLGAQEASSLGAQDLSKPVTLAVKGEALSDITAMLSRQAGLKVRATKDIANQKATIFVDNKPLKDVLDGLSTILGYRWSVVRQTDGSKTYELWESPKAKLAREAATGGAVVAAWHEMDARNRGIAASTQEEQKQFRHEYEQLTASFAGKEHLTPEETARIKALGGRFGPRATIARLYSRLSPVALQALQFGASVYLDTNTNETEWRVPPDIDTDLMAQVLADDKDPRLWSSRPPAGYNLELQPIITDKVTTQPC